MTGRAAVPRSPAAAGSPGPPGELRRLDDPAAIAAAVVALAGSARRELLLLTAGCEPALFDQGPFLAAVRALAIARAAQQPVCVLCPEPPPGRGREPRLFALARRLPSAVALRVLPDDLPRAPDGVLIGDGRGCCVLPDAMPGVAFCGADAGAAARRERRRFLALWAVALPSVELRRLVL